MTSAPATGAARTVALDLAAPAAVYDGRRLAGCGTAIAFVAGGALPALDAGHTALRAHRVDTIAVLTCVTILLSTAIAVVTADPRTLLARSAAVSGVARSRRYAVGTGIRS